MLIRIVASCPFIKHSFASTQYNTIPFEIWVPLFLSNIHVYFHTYLCVYDRSKMCAQLSMNSTAGWRAHDEHVQHEPYTPTTRTHGFIARQMLMFARCMLFIIQELCVGSTLYKRTFCRREPHYFDRCTLRSCLLFVFYLFFLSTYNAELRKRMFHCWKRLRILLSAGEMNI